YENNQFDAIFDFGIIHHIPNWKACLKELKRILKFGGELIIEDISIETFNTFSGKILKKLLKHPYDKMYNINEFIDYLKYLGFQISKYKIYHPLFLLKYFVVIAEK
ncbi:MAG: methyltransferase domain-containing protein, partial [Candidatus Aminicenantes bacterium]|nr:methyltransferase domain-containing protein [Candidatus Aminicenantes bacterium]